MSLHPQSEYPVPEQTRRVARAAFPKGTLAIGVADALGTVYSDAPFADLFPRRGRPADAPARLALARCCSSRKASPIARLRTPCAGASTGRMPWPWN